MKTKNKLCKLCDKRFNYQCGEFTRHLPDFKFKDDYIIEIKSSYVMKRQGGEKVIDAKKTSVESTGMKYLLILDNDFSEFDKILREKEVIC